LNAETYDALRKQAEGMGHHAENDVNESHAHESVETEHSMKQSKTTHEHDDHEY